MRVTSNGVELHVEVHGDGDPVLLLHGWPDDAGLWRYQVPALTKAGFLVIAPDLRGFGRSARPAGQDAYKLASSVADVAAILDAVLSLPPRAEGRADVLGLSDEGENAGLGRPEASRENTVHVVGHDWGAAVAWLTAMYLPDRVRTLTALSVPHPAAPVTARQREMAWYQLFFQFEEVAEATLRHDDWAALRELASGYRDLDRAIANLSRPGALTASLNWYRANLAPRMPGRRPELPPVKAPTLGIWSDGDRYLDGARMRASGDLVKGPWRYAEISGATHWIPLDAPEELNALLLDWLSSARDRPLP
jgi:pimeloyl-ACP methyl ester carboxylesterase